MPDFPWKGLLTQWGKDIASGNEQRDDLPAEAGVSGWPYYPGATEAQITRAERRLKTIFPPSYQEFLKTTNGCSIAGPFVQRLLSAEEVDWFAAKNQDWIDHWRLGYTYFGEPEPVNDEDYFVYGEKQNPLLFRHEYLDSALQISAGDEEVYILNPRVIFKDGEWEAWVFESEMGAARYRSFWELMQAEHQSFSLLKEHEGKRLQGDESDRQMSNKLPGLVEELEQKIKAYQQIGTGIQADVQYKAGIIQGLNYAVSQVRDIQNQAPNPEEIHQQLRSLADELESKWQQAFKASQSSFDLSQMLSQGIDQILHQIHAAGLPEGYREAAGIIRWFLGK